MTVGDEQSKPAVELADSDRGVIEPQGGAIAEEPIGAASGGPTGGKGPELSKPGAGRFRIVTAPAGGRWRAPATVPLPTVGRSFGRTRRPVQRPSGPPSPPARRAAADDNHRR